MSETAITQGAHHIGLTVPDLAKTRAFFLDTLGFSQVGEMPDYPAVFLTDGSTMITLWQAENPNKAVAFDRKNVIGLHHFALKVGSADALEALHEKLKTVDGVQIEFAPEPLGGGPASHMMCAIPGGIRTEFIALPS
ncbi:MAG: VOC family protein [Hyphomicrobiaceae bacterium]|jgi:catechol 2,3-dioxygenase-like lactoylglutathione lyase family enzyme|nr:VOC family protein [Hyphomicrobiaceae bacterium]MDX2450898.1 VOC family protein [Hyphomicrobiaceae bacterium]